MTGKSSVSGVSALALVVLLICGFAFAGTMRFGLAQTGVISIIGSDTTWVKASSPYSLTGPVAVSTGVTLTVEAGVTVNLNDYYLLVNGTLRVLGSSADRIHFNGGNITFTQYSDGWNEQTGSGSIIENAILDQTPISSVNSLKISGNTINGEVAVGASSAVLNNVITGRTFSPHDTLPNAVAVGASSVVSGNTINGTQTHGQAMASVYDLCYGINVTGSSAVVSNNVVTGDIRGSSITITYNTVTGGVYGDSSTISHNTITGDVSGSSLAVADNNIAGGEPTYDWAGRSNDPTSAITVYGAGSSVISNNTITSPTGGFGITIMNPSVYSSAGTTATSHTYIFGNVISGSITGIRAGGNSTIEGNLITDNTGSVGGYINDRGYGIEIGHISFNGFNERDIGEGNVVIRDNTIKNNPVGIGGSTGGTATIERNLITNNTEGISTGSLVTIRNSTITDSSVGIRLSKSSPATINYNNIQNNIQNSIYLEGTSNNTDATYNWWGTTDTQSINMTIHDSKYDFNLGKVTFLPFSTESNPNALPRSNLTLPPMPSPTPTDTPAPAQSPAPTFSPAPTQSSTPSPSQNPSPLPSQSPISMPDQSSSQDASQMWLYGIVAVLAAMNVALIVVVVVLVIRKKR